MLIAQELKYYTLLSGGRSCAIYCLSIHRQLILELTNHTSCLSSRGSVSFTLYTIYTLSYTIYPSAIAQVITGGMVLGGGDGVVSCNEILKSLKTQ